MSLSISEEQFDAISFEGLKIDAVELAAYKDCNQEDTTLISFVVADNRVAIPATLFRLYALQIPTVPCFPPQLTAPYNAYADHYISFFALSTMNRSFEQIAKTRSALRVLFTARESHAFEQFPQRMLDIRGLIGMLAKPTPKSGEPTAYCVIEQAAQENEADLLVLSKFLENAAKMKESLGSTVKDNLDSPVCSYFYKILKEQLKHWATATYQTIPCLRVFSEMIQPAIALISEARKLRVKVEDKQMVEMAEQLALKQHAVEEYCQVIRSYYEVERSQALSIFQDGASAPQE